jgi:hypothetical protein
MFLNGSRRSFQGETAAHDYSFQDNYEKILGGKAQSLCDRPVGIGDSNLWLSPYACKKSSPQTLNKKLYIKTKG